MFTITQMNSGGGSKCQNAPKYALWGFLHNDRTSVDDLITVK